MKNGYSVRILCALLVCALTASLVRSECCDDGDTSRFCEAYRNNLSSEERLLLQELLGEDCTGGGQLLEKRKPNFIRFGLPGRFLGKFGPRRILRSVDTEPSFLRFGREMGDDPNFLRFGKRKPNFLRVGRKPNFLRFGKRAAADDETLNFLRFGKRKPNFLRFGKRDEEPNFLRFGKRKPNFLRFGKRAEDEDPNFLRFGKRKPNFLRFGRSSDFERKMRKPNFLRFGRATEQAETSAKKKESPTS